MSHEEEIAVEQSDVDPFRDSYGYRDLLAGPEVDQPETAPVLMSEQLDEFLNREAEGRTVELVGVDELPRKGYGMSDIMAADRLGIKSSKVPKRLLWVEWIKPTRDANKQRGQTRYLSREELDKALKNPTFHGLVQEAIDKQVIAGDKRDIKNQAWWLMYDDESIVNRNPFEDEATEQVVFGHDGREINLYNFEAELTDWEVKDIQAALHELDIMTNGLVFKVLQNIVVTDDLSDVHFKIGDYVAPPGGVAHTGKGIISLDRGVMRHYATQHNEAGTKSILMRLVYHEVAHLLDGYLRTFIKQQNGASLPAVFKHYFDYSDVEGDPRQKITPRSHITTIAKGGGQEIVDVATLIDEEDFLDSRPEVDYGYTNAKEDFATAMERFMIGYDDVDPVRREAILDILRYAAARGNVYTEGREAEARSLAEEIYEPSKPLMAETLRYVEGEHGLVVEQASAAMQATRRQGDDIVYPKVDTSLLHRTTQGVVYIDTSRA